ncbi:MAG: hypothetical protein IJC59_05810 [Lachnospiraceae bacterium]|nr:hypothetical protein [Lachnospiraceae bacterium]
MKWWKRIVDYFQRAYEEEDLELEWEGASIEDWDWDTLVKDRSLMKMRDAGEREKFVANCLEQMSSASAELDKLSDEYNVVTSYLTDIEEIEALPAEEAELVKGSAKKIVQFETARKEFDLRTNRMPEAKFRHMEQYEEIMPKPYEDIVEAENYRELIKGDISRLEGEKHAYQYRKGELMAYIANAKGMVAICVMAMAACLLMLLILQFGFDMDTGLGYILTIAAGALVITGLYVKYLDYTAELKRTEKGLNRIILLKNTVNIRYVNNINLLDYLYMKYQVKSAKELKKLWENYQKEKEERAREQENRQELDYYKKELLQTLRRFQLDDPDIWVYQAQALLDHREMVEIRHNLIERRQKLRIQMDYNKRLAQEGQKEIKTLLTAYPEYQEEIMHMVNRYNP